MWLQMFLDGSISDDNRGSWNDLTRINTSPLYSLQRYPVTLEQVQYVLQHHSLSSDNETYAYVGC